MTIMGGLWSIFDDFGRDYVAVCSGVFPSNSQNGKLCLDCTGVDGLHVRPSRGTSVFMFLFIDFLTLFHNVAFCRLFIDFGTILGGFWCHFGFILTTL